MEHGPLVLRQRCTLVPFYAFPASCRPSPAGTRGAPAARLAAHVEPPRDVAASAEDIDAADFAASVELEESMEAFRTEEACALRRLVAFSDIQQTLRAAAVDEEQLKRQLDEMRNCFMTATTQQDPHLFLESLTRAHEDFTFGLTTNTQCHSGQYLSSQHSR
jgi:hypothetical protein